MLLLRQRAGHRLDLVGWAVNEGYVACVLGRRGVLPRQTWLPALALVFVSACSSAQAESRVAASTSLPTCKSSYSVLGTATRGKETESVAGVVFTDRKPLECKLARPDDRVAVSFNDTATDPSTGCTYRIARFDKTTRAVIGSQQILSCGNPQLHFEVAATPDSANPACRGLSPIIVDPKMVVNPSKPTSSFVCPY